MEAWQNQRHYGITWRSPALLERSHWSDAQGNPLSFPCGQSPRRCPDSWEVVVTISTDADGWQYASVFKHFDYTREGGRASQRATDFVRRRSWRRKAGPSDANATAHSHSNAASNSAQQAAVATANALISPTTVMSSARSGSTSSNLLTLTGTRCSSSQSMGPINAIDASSDNRERNVHYCSIGIKAESMEPFIKALAAYTQKEMQCEMDITSMTTGSGLVVRKQTETERRKSVVRIFVGMFAGCIKRHQIWNVIPWDPAAWWVMYNQHQAALLELQQDNMHTQIDLKALSQPTDQSQPDMADRLPETDEQRPSLVRELLCAAIHSRAAYGYAMAAGHMSNLLNFALMHTVHHISFDVAGGASAEANNIAVSQLAGLDTADVIMGEWSNSVMRPCHYIAADPANHCIVLAIRGSLEVGDVLSDLSANPMELSLLGIQGKVHEGMMSAATFVHCNTAEALQSAARTHPGWPLVVTGHSMGGGVAAIVAALLRDGTAPEGLGPVRCCIISPAAVFSGNLSEACRPFTTSLILRSDAVPRLSYASVEGVFVELVGASPVRRAASDVKNRVEQMLEGLKMGWVFNKPARQARPSGIPLNGLNTVSPLLDDDEAIDAASHAATEAYRQSNPQKSKARKLDKADSAQRLRSRQDDSDSVVDAAQFAESMVPEGLHSAALPRNPSQTSLSGAAPGGVLDTRPHSAALPCSSSHRSLPRVMSSTALDARPHGRALPRNASSSSLTGAGPRSGPDTVHQGSVQRAQGSDFRWPWQVNRPGRAMRQLQPSQQTSIAMTHPFTFPNMVPEAEGSGQCNLPSQLAITASSQSEATTDQEDIGSMPNQADRLADKALERIAAAQQDIRQAAAVLDASSWMKSNAGSLSRANSGAFCQPSSPQHNSRLKACAKSDRLRQWITESNRQLQQPDCVPGSAEGAEPRGRAARGLVEQPLHGSAAVAEDPAESKSQRLKAGEQEHALRDNWGCAEQSLSREDVPEGPQHAGNAGSQAATLGSNAVSAEAHRSQENIADMLGISRLEADGPPAPLYPAGRILWMLPAPDRSPSQDAHVPVANPDNAQHPEEDTHMSGVQSADQASLPGVVGAEEDDGKAEEGEPRMWQGQPILLDVQKECFSRLLLLPEILTDHLPDTYLAAVQQL